MNKCIGKKIEEILDPEAKQTGFSNINDERRKFSETNL